MGVLQHRDRLRNRGHGCQVRRYALDAFFVSTRRRLANVSPLVQRNQFRAALQHQVRRRTVRARRRRTVAVLCEILQRERLAPPLIFEPSRRAPLPTLARPDSPLL